MCKPCCTSRVPRPRHCRLEAMASGARMERGGGALVKLHHAEQYMANDAAILFGNQRQSRFSRGVAEHGAGKIGNNRTLGLAKGLQVQGVYGCPFVVSGWADDHGSWRLEWGELRYRRSLFSQWSKDAMLPWTIGSSETEMKCYLLVAVEQLI